MSPKSVRINIPQTQDGNESDIRALVEAIPNVRSTLVCLFAVPALPLFFKLCMLVTFGSSC